MNSKAAGTTDEQFAADTIIESPQTTMQGPGEELIGYVYEELRKLAKKRMGRLANGGDTLQPTALVNEVYLRLTKNPGKIWKGRRHFFNAAGLAMRHLLIGRARSKRAQKHGGGLQRVDITVTLGGEDDAMLLSAEELFSLDRALTELQEEDPNLVEVVLMRYFCGLTIAETADILEVSTRTVERRWRFARAWLRNQLSE